MDIQQLESIINEFRKEYVNKSINAIDFDNIISEKFNVNDSLFDSSYNLYDGQKAYYINDNYNLMIEYSVLYDSIFIAEIDIFINDIYLI